MQTTGRGRWPIHRFAGGPGSPPPKPVAKWLIGAATAGVFVLALWWAGGWQALWEIFSDRERLQSVVEGSGALAPVAYLSLLVFQAVVLPLPAPPMAFAGGFFFGTGWGFALTWAGALLGGAACFGLSRAFGRRLVIRSERARRLDSYVQRHGALAVFVLRLIPLVSFDAISYAAGLSALPFWKFLLATALGMTPGTFAFVYLGGSPPGPGLYAALGAVAALGVAAYLYFIRRLRPLKEPTYERAGPVP